jgi:hypothetical protein
MLKARKQLKVEITAWNEGNSYIFAAHTIQAVAGCHLVAEAISAERWSEISSDCVGRNSHDWRRRLSKNCAEHSGPRPSQARKKKRPAWRDRGKATSRPLEIKRGAVLA